MTKLRNYQVLGTKLLNDSFRAGNKRVIACFPTGAGKSTWASNYVKICLKHGKRVLFMVHSKELVKQFAERLYKQFNLPSGVIMSGVSPSIHNKVQVASVQTLVRRKKPLADLVIIDECHRSKANTYQKILEFYPDARILGLTATPFRGDGKPLGDIFEDIVHPVKIRELINRGFLVPTKVVAPKESADLSKVKTVAGEFHKGQMYDAFNDGAITRGVVNNYINRAKGKRAIVFNCSVEHSKEMNQMFIAHGVKAAHVDGNTDKKERDRIVKDFSQGKIDVLNSIDIYTEGFDIPATEVVILNRATKSEGLYIQMVGRGLRPFEGKSECLVLDHGGNTIRFGYVEDYDQVEFSLNDKRKEPKEKKAKMCKSCKEGVMKYFPSQKKYVCQSCGDSYDTEIKRSRKFSEECEFEVLDRDYVIVKRLVNMSNKDAKDKLPVSQLRLYKELRGYKNGWVLHTMLERYKDIDENTENIWQIINYRLKVAEIEGDTHRLYRDIKNQINGKGKKIHRQEREALPVESNKIQEAPLHTLF